jgi:hypothetical protein
MIFAGSENMRIKFEPIILRVTDKFCGEWWVEIKYCGQ